MKSIFQRSNPAIEKLSAEAGSPKKVMCVPIDYDLWQSLLFQRRLGGGREGACGIVRPRRGRWDREWRLADWALNLHAPHVIVCIESLLALWARESHGDSFVLAVLPNNYLGGSA